MTDIDLRARPVTRARWWLVWLVVGLAFWLAVGLVFVNVAKAAEPNRFVYLNAPGAVGTRAQIALGAASPGQAVFVSVGGSRFLDIIQVGAKVELNGRRHYFAAYGRGIPNGIGSLYVERDLGPVNRSWHRYEVRLSGGTWRFVIDGTIRLRIADTFRDWSLRLNLVADEAEYGGALGGTTTLPVRIREARVFRGGWTLPAFGAYGTHSWAQGGYRVPAGTRIAIGRDALTVWR
jgi:hypothetical protein